MYSPAVLQLSSELVDEYLKRLERDGHTREYGDGALDGISFTLEFLQAMIHLRENKSRFMKEEQNVKT